MVSKNLRNFFSLALVAVSVLSMGINDRVYAMESEQPTSESLINLEDEINSTLDDILNEFAEINSINVTFEGAEVKIAETALETYDCIDEIKGDIYEHINEFMDGMLAFETEIIEIPDTIQSRISKSGSTYTSSVWSGVPGIGWGYIKQDFTCTVSSGVIGTCTGKGSSYTSGFTIGTWAPNYTTYTRSNSNKYLDISMKGTYKYGIGDFALSYPCTFLEQVKGSGSTLVSR